MANDADAAERAVNGSTTVLPPSVRHVRQLSGPAEPDSSNNDDEHLDDTTAVDEGQAGEQTGSTAEPAAASDDPDEATKPTDAKDDTDERAGKPRFRMRAPGIRFALIVGLVTIVALAGLGGWLGYDVYRAHQADKVRNLFLAVGKQGALNLTTINYTEADTDIQRILDSSTGQFYDDFSKRAPAFVDVVKQAQAKTDGRIVEAGLESVNGDSARVLVAVLVTTSNKGATDQPPRHWRMRVDVQKVGDTVKVANVGFVP